MRYRPGQKPERYRRGAPEQAEAVEPGLRIPQLRPRYGEENRRPRVTEVRRRTRRLQRLPMRGYEPREAEAGPAYRRHHRHGQAVNEEAGPAHRQHHRHREREEEVGPAYRQHRRHRDEEAGPAHRQHHRHHVPERRQLEPAAPVPLPLLDLPLPARDAPEQQRQQEGQGGIVRFFDVIRMDLLPPPPEDHIQERFEDVADLLHEMFIPQGQHLHVPRRRQRWDILPNLEEDVGHPVEFAPRPAHHDWGRRFAQGEASSLVERIQQWAQGVPPPQPSRGRRHALGHLYPEIPRMAR